MEAPHSKFISYFSHKYISLGYVLLPFVPPRLFRPLVVERLEMNYEGAVVLCDEKDGFPVRAAWAGVLWLCPTHD
jgi:hypothetical protein